MEKKLTGRKKGKQNKLTTFTKETIQRILNDYTSMGQFWEDFLELTPVQRMTIAEKYFNYISPKMQATTVDVAVQKDKSIEDKLKELAQQHEQ